MTICTREKPLSFVDLQSMLMVEENHASGSSTTQSDSRMLYTEANGPVGVGDEVDRHAIVVANRSRKEGTEAVPTTVPYPPQGGGVKAAPETGKQRPKRNVGTLVGRAIERERLLKKHSDSDKSGATQRERERLLKKRSDLDKSESGKAKQGSQQRSHYAKGSRTGKGSSDEVWYVYSGASNHMMSHEEWFSHLE